MHAKLKWIVWEIGFQHCCVRKKTKTFSCKCLPNPSQADMVWRRGLTLYVRSNSQWSPGTWMKSCSLDCRWVKMCMALTIQHAALFLCIMFNMKQIKASKITVISEPLFIPGWFKGILCYFSGKSVRERKYLNHDVIIIYAQLLQTHVKEGGRI